MSDLETLEKKSAPKHTQSAPTQKAWQWRWHWQWLIAPLMGISILLHLVLLFVPLPGLDLVEEEAIEEAPSEEDEEAPIDILSLSEIAAPEPPPETPPEQPQPQQPQAPPPAGAVPPPPDPEQVQELPAETEEQLFEEELPLEEGFEEPPASFDPGVATQQFIGDISSLGVQDYTDSIGIPPPEYFSEPGNVSCFLQPNREPNPDVREVRLLDKSPQTLLRENLPQAYEPLGITFTPLEPYCGELYYEAITAEGEPFMKFSLVALEGSTLLVIWEIPPQ